VDPLTGGRVVFGRSARAFALVFDDALGRTGLDEQDDSLLGLRQP
jgi:hypothetical protein